MNEEINIFSFGFNRHLQKSFLQKEVEVQIRLLDNNIKSVEDRVDRFLQTGGSITTLVPGLMESTYNGN